ncbi:MAG: DUF58 domain-containing protein [Clostridiales bacterium]|nr:DUF58 domain-containing protein [Clostridiales bacterium]
MKGGFLSDEFFDRLEVLSLNFKANLAGVSGGSHKIMANGQTIEFADNREYNLGDDIRKIDWNLYARFEKYFVKLFTDERRMHIRIFIDCSRSMGVIRSKAEYALSIAAAFGFLSVKNLDKVTFYFIHDDSCDNPFGDIIGKNDFFTIVGKFKDVKFEGDAKISDAVLKMPYVSSNDGLTVIISDFFTDNDWKNAVKFFNYKRHQILLIQTLTPDEIKPSYTGRNELIDSETEYVDGGRHLKMRISRQMIAAYAEAMDEYTNEIKSFTRKVGADFMTVSTGRPVEDVFFKELFKVGLNKT